MPYCTRCGKEIAEGARCSCQKPQFQVGDLFAGGDYSKETPKKEKNPVEAFEHGMKIVPENVKPDEGEIPVRQYDLCRMRSRLKLMFAEGRLQVTNKRIIFRAKGKSLTGPTLVQHEFTISEISGFQILRNARFSGLDLLLILILNAVCIGLTAAIAMSSITADAGTLLRFLLYLAGVAGLFFAAKNRKNRLGCALLSGLSVGALGSVGYILTLLSKWQGSSGKAFLAALCYIPAAAALVLLVISTVVFCMKPNLQFSVCSKMGKGAIDIRCEPTGFGRSIPMINAVFTGYNEVLPTDETDLAVGEIGAMISDIQKLGDLAIEKWKHD